MFTTAANFLGQLAFLADDGADDAIVGAVYAVGDMAAEIDGYDFEGGTYGGLLGALAAAIGGEAGDFLYSAAEAQLVADGGEMGPRYTVTRANNTLTVTRA